jgi:hypothetical protein
LFAARTSVISTEKQLLKFISLPFTDLVREAKSDLGELSIESERLALPVKGVIKMQNVIEMNESEMLEVVGGWFGWGGYTSKVKQSNYAKIVNNQTAFGLLAVNYSNNSIMQGNSN